MSIISAKRNCSDNNPLGAWGHRSVERVSLVSLCRMWTPRKLRRSNDDLSHNSGGKLIREALIEAVTVKYQIAVIEAQ